MTIWALADLHLAISCPEKDMAIFGPNWEGYMDKMAANWREVVKPEDLVLIPGDITWAMRQEDARRDLKWIGELPGTKMMIRGNHDYWWSSLKKVKGICPPSLLPLHHSAANWNQVSVAGTRLWDNPDEMKTDDPDQTRKIYERELGRLEIACKALDQQAELRIAITHYPPITGDRKPSPASAILEKYNVDICLFGHIHKIDPHPDLFGELNGIRYILCAADYIDFRPLKVL